MGKLAAGVFLLSIFFFDFAAIDDITLGKSSDSLLQFLVLGLSIAIFLSIGVLIYKNRKNLKPFE